MKHKLIHIIGPFVGLVLFTAALWVIRHELNAYHLHDILRKFHDLPAKTLLSACLFTALSYFLMTGYDYLALRYIQHPLSYAKTALASFIGYAFSNNVGFSMIAGASVRYRLYTTWGLSAFEITQVVGFCSLTLWLGFLALGGIVFLLEPLVLPAALHLPFTSVHIIGIICLVIVIGVVFMSMVRNKPLKIRDWTFSFPSPSLLSIQIVFSALDWLIASSVLYTLLPSTPAITFPVFIGIFMTAQFIGLISQVPGGLGIFESTILLLLSHSISAPEIVGSLLAYRGIYYLIPLLSATGLLGIQEILRYSETSNKIMRGFGKLVSSFVPQILAFSTFMGGALLLFSGSTPALFYRLEFLRNIIPLTVVEVSHFLGSLVGGALLILSRGLQRRINAAYFFTIFLLAFGIIFSLLKGLDYEEGIILFIMLGALLPFRKYFYRSASVFRVSFSPGWIAGILAVLICSLWLGFFSFKHVEYRTELWWHFAFAGNAPRFLRAMVGVVAFMLFFVLARFLSPVSPKPAGKSGEEMERVSAVVNDSVRTGANLAFLGDKSFLISQSGNAFIMYGIEKRSWISMGDPVGPIEEWPELIWQFREMVDRYDGWTVFYEVGSQELPFYLDLGLSLLKLGEEARVDLNKFTLEGSSRKGLRYTIRQMEKEGSTFQVVPKEDVHDYIPEFKKISDSWLNEKHTGEKGFSLGFFNEEYLQRFPAAIVRKDNKILAFSNLWPGWGKEEFSIDLMRYLPDAPHGVMEYLFIKLILWGKTEGYQWFNMGMAPLSGFEGHRLASIWSRVGSYIFQHGEHFYNFQGLRQYKEKFDPEWSPKYLVCPSGLALPRILANIQTLISGSLRSILVK